MKMLSVKLKSSTFQSHHLRHNRLIRNKAGVVEVEEKLLKCTSTSLICPPKPDTGVIIASELESKLLSRLIDFIFTSNTDNNAYDHLFLQDYN